MRRWVLAGLVIAGPVASGAQSVATAGPADDPVRDASPRFVITTAGFTAAQLPLQLRLQVSFTGEFAGPFWADTTVTGTTATIVIPRLLPTTGRIWWRTIARTAQGTLIAENAFGPRRLSAWVSLKAPNNVNGSTLDTTTPTLTWSARLLYPPVAPWRFIVEVSRSADGLVVYRAFDDDTTHVVNTELETNTSYRWALSAVAPTGDSVRVASLSSFVIVGANAPIATVLFQPFPNPFPNDRLSATCIWFDLKAQASVKLDILDLRGNQVARIFPGRGFETFPPGRYGRDVFGGDSGCDTRFRWDGSDDAGRAVRPGVYLVRFRADGLETYKKVLFRGK